MSITVQSPTVQAPRSLRVAPEGVVPKGPARAQIPGDRGTLEKKLANLVHKANIAYDLIGPGDKVMVCLSGGKDSYGLLHFLQHMQRVAPFDFEILAVHLDQGHPGFPLATLEAFMRDCGSPWEIIHEHTHDLVLDKLKPGKTTCSLCSRLRRGILYDNAVRLGCTKIALGHHRDDLLATLLLNLFFCGQLKAMPPKLISDDRRNTVIRPLAFVPEAWLERWAELEGYPLIPCSLCSKQPDLKRAQMEQLLRQIDGTWSAAMPSALNALQNVHPRFLADASLFDFAAAADGGAGAADGGAGAAADAPSAVLAAAAGADRDADAFS